MMKVKFFMKSGNVIEFECEDLEVRHNKMGDLMGYTVDFGDSKKKIIDANIGEIEGISMEEVVKKGRKKKDEIQENSTAEAE